MFSRRQEEIKGMENQPIDLNNNKNPFGELEIYSMVTEMKKWYPHKLYLRELKVNYSDYPEEIRY